VERYLDYPCIRAGAHLPSSISYSRSLYGLYPVSVGGFVAGVSSAEGFLRATPPIACRSELSRIQFLLFFSSEDNIDFWSKLLPLSIAGVTVERSLEWFSSYWTLQEEKRFLGDILQDVAL